MPENFVLEFFKNYGGNILTAILAFTAAWFWRRKDRKIGKKDKKKDRKNVASREESQALAKTVEKLKYDTAQSVEDTRVKRAEAVEAGHDALIQEIKELHVELQTLKEHYIEIKAQVVPMWTAVQARLIKDLTHPHPQFKKPDALLAKLLNLEITESERDQLNVMMDERIVSDDPEVSDDEKSSARILKDVMQKVVNEDLLIKENKLLKDVQKETIAIPDKKEET